MKHPHLFNGARRALQSIILFFSFARVLLFGTLFFSLNGIAGSVLPTPQVIVAGAMTPRIIDSQWNIAVDTADAKQLFNANYLQSSLTTEFSLTLNVVDITTRTAGGKYILLGKVNHPALNSFLVDRQLVLDPRVGGEGYLLKVFADDQVLITANSDAGVFHGIQSLLHVEPDTTSAFQLLYIANGQVRIDGVAIQDWPDKPIRGMYLTNDRCASAAYYMANPGACSYENYMLFVEKMARMKMNYVATGSREPSIFGGAYNALPGFFAKAKELYITPVPTLAGMAQGADFISSNPHIAEGIPAIGEPFVVVRSGDNLILSPENQVDRTGELTNADMEVEVTTWSSTNPGSGWYFAPTTVTCVASDTSCTTGSQKTVIHWTWDQTNAHDVVSSLKIDVPQSWATNYPQSFSSPVYIRKWLPVESKKTYTLSFWVKTDAISGSAPQILVVQYDSVGAQAVGSDGSVNSAYLATGTHGWRQYFMSVPTTPTTAYLLVAARLQPGGYGQLWLDDFELRRMDGALTNVIRTALTDIAVTSVDGSIGYTEGSDYIVSDGVMEFNTNANNSNYRFYPLNTPSVIGIPASSRLHENDHVLLSYDYALKVDSEASANWTHCYSSNEPDTYDKYVYPRIGNLMRELGSDAIFYSGSDEIRGINRDRRNQGKSSAQLIGEDVSRIYQKVKQVNPDALFFAWDDMVDPWHNGGNEYYQFKYGGAKGASEPAPSADAALPRATDFLPRKDFLHVIWWYGAVDSLGVMANAPGYFESKGFEWIASPYDNSENILAWGRTIADRPMNKGLIGTAWSNFSGFPLSASVAWNNLQETRPSADVDADGINDNQDNCPFISNPTQLDVNGNGTGDVCETLDLQLTISATPNPALVNNQLTYTATIYNAGSSTASGINLSGLNDCILPATTLTSGTNMSCSVTVSPNRVGNLTQSANVTGGQTDPNVANNSSTVSTNVQGFLTVNKTGLGTVTSSPPGINCSTDCTEPYDANTGITLTATADSNSVFGSWSGCDSVAGTSCTVNINTSRSVTANYNPAVLPDLVHLRLTADHFFAAHFLIRDQVKNQGDGLASASTISYYLSTDTEYQSGSDTLIGSRPQSSLNAGVTFPKSSTTNTALPKPAVPYGYYYVLAVDDSGSVVSESNEGNNIFLATSSPLSIGADLTPPTGTVTASKTGTTLTLGDQVKNQGTAPTGPFKVGFYVSANATFDASDVFICGRTISSLGAGQSNPTSGSAITTCAAPVMPAGSYYVLAVDDYENNSVIESSETNNVGATTSTLSW